MSDAALEYLTVGALLASPGELDAVRPWLQPADFEHPQCAEVYDVMLTMSSADIPITATTVRAELGRLGRLRPDGWPGTELPKMVAPIRAPGAAKHYARLILEDATFRELEYAGQLLARLARERGSVDHGLALVAEQQRVITGIGQRWSRASGTSSEAHGRSQLRASRGRTVDRVSLAPLRGR
jgi:replicative DNA helicase